MHRRIVALACMTALLAGVLGGTATANTADAKTARTATTVGAASVAASAADDNIPGVYLPPPPFEGALDEFSDYDDVYAVAMEAGDAISIGLSAGTGASADQDYDLYIYGPTATDVTSDVELFSSTNVGTNESALFYAPTTGTYYIDIWCYSGSGGYAVNYTYHPTVPRVHRFYNARLGTHFYTRDETEKYTVMRTLSSVLTYEGVAYKVQPWPTNPDFLHRFYMPSTGSHFYTADLDEKARVQATMGNIYSYEGIAYPVSRANASGTYPAIWRFYNMRNGTHFYTADLAERDRVITTLGYIYSFDGPAFYLAQ